MSDVRSVKLTLTGATGNDWYCQPITSSGAALCVGGEVIKDGDSLTLSASNDREAINGTFALNKGSIQGPTCFTVTYSAAHSGTTGVKITPQDKAHTAVIGPSTRRGSTIVAGLTLYNGKYLYDAGKDKDGHAVPAIGVIDLGDAPMTLAAKAPWVFADLVNQMFDPNLRSPAHVEALAAAATKTINSSWDRSKAPPVFFADFTGGQIPAIVAMWSDYWINGAACPASDAALIDLFKSFLTQGDQPLNLWLPRISVDDAGPPVVLKLEAYDKLGFYKGGSHSSPQWSESTVKAFLTLIAAGAHFVTICANQDLTEIKGADGDESNFYRYLTKSDFRLGDELVSSHYVPSAPEGNTAGWYYLDVDGEQMPRKVTLYSNNAASDPGQSVDTGLIVALATSGTVTDSDSVVSKGNYNAFFQSEGWQQQGVTGGDRHMDDYDTYQVIMWNISTLGACPYSEKRATAVFLAPDGWTPKVTDTTCMMPYVGAYAVQTTYYDRGTGTSTKGDVEPQPWLIPRLVTPVDATPLASGYIVQDQEDIGSFPIG